MRTMKYEYDSRTRLVETCNNTVRTTECFSRRAAGIMAFEILYWQVLTTFLTALGAPGPGVNKLLGGVLGCEILTSARA